MRCSADAVSLAKFLRRWKRKSGQVEDEVVIRLQGASDDGDWIDIGKQIAIRLTHGADLIGDPLLGDHQALLLRIAIGDLVVVDAVFHEQKFHCVLGVCRLTSFHAAPGELFWFGVLASHHLLRGRCHLGTLLFGAGRPLGRCLLRCHCFDGGFGGYGFRGRRSNNLLCHDGGDS